MLAPIVTKDMKLFPTQKLPEKVKNVRSRAQSLDQFQQLQNSGSARGRYISIKPRNSVSTGNIPSASKSPPKGSITRKTTLTAIQEGVELAHPSAQRRKRIPQSQSESSSVQSATTSSSASSTNACRSCSEGRRSASDSSPSERRKKSSILKWFSSKLRKLSGSKVMKDKATETTSTMSN